MHGLLGLAGPLVIATTMLLWYALLVLSGVLLFSATGGSVLRSASGDPAGGAEVPSFVTTTLSSVGYGDLVPAGPGWTVVATTLALLATMVLTLSLSYVISVVGAALSRCTTAASLQALGGTPAQLVTHTLLDEERGTMTGQLVTCAGSVQQVAAQQRTYPVLAFFRAGLVEACRQDGWEPPELHRDDAAHRNGGRTATSA